MIAGRLQFIMDAQYTKPRRKDENTRTTCHALQIFSLRVEVQILGWDWILR